MTAKTSAAELYEHIIAKIHSLKQNAARELASLEKAGERIAFLKVHIANIDAELISAAYKVKDAGEYLLHWHNVETMPQAAKELLTANQPKPDPVIVAATPEPAPGGQTK